MNQLSNFILLTILCLACNSPSSKLDCENIKGLDKILKKGQIILLGELHGTNEAPHYLYQMACQALNKGHQVSIALEFPQNDQADLEIYLASQGTDEDKKLFLSQPLWSDEYQDGKRSIAMFNLIDRIRLLIRQGYPLNIFYMDGYGNRGREHTMASNIIKTREQNPNNIILSLVGNFHNTIVNGSDKMGSLILKKYGKQNVVSLDQNFVDGTAWINTGNNNSGPMEINGNGSSGIGIYLHKTPTEYHGTFEMHKITHSPPAKELLRTL